MAFCEIEPFCQKVLKKHWPEVPIYEDVKALTGPSMYEILALCQHLEKINIQMHGPCMIKGCQCSKSLISLQSLDRQCTIFSSVEKLYSVLNYVMEKTTISIEAEKHPLIMPKMHLNTLYEKVLLFGKRIAKNAEIIQLLKTGEQEYKRTTATITSLWKLCGYVNHAITNGTNTIRLSKGGFCEAAGTIDVITGGFP